MKEAKDKVILASFWRVSNSLPIKPYFWIGVLMEWILHITSEVAKKVLIMFPQFNQILNNYNKRVTNN